MLLSARHLGYFDYIPFLVTSILTFLVDFLSPISSLASFACLTLTLVSGSQGQDMMILSAPVPGTWGCFGDFFASITSILKTLQLSEDFQL